VEAQTDALVFGVGDSDTVLLGREDLAALRLDGSAAAINHCVGVEQPRCPRVDGIFVHELSAFAGSTLRLRTRGACVRLSFLEGGGQLIFRVDRNLGGDGADASAEHSVELNPLSSVRYCTDQSFQIVLRSPRFVVLGDTLADAIAERNFQPAGAQVDVAFPSTGQSRRFGPTDVVWLEGLESAEATLRSERGLQISLGATADRVAVTRAGVAESANPTWLDRLVGAPGLKAALSFTAGLWAALSLLRARLDDLRS
jgi:hypothetical protein